MPRDKELLKQAVENFAKVVEKAKEVSKEVRQSGASPQEVSRA